MGANSEKSSTKSQRPSSVKLAMRRYDRNMALMKAKYPGKSLQEILNLRKQEQQSK
jgi:hypothetical protein